MNELYLSVIIPAYKESDRIASTLEEVSVYLNSQKYNYELIVVDDGSTDDTFEQAKSRENLFDNFKLLKNEKNMGKGYSVKRGMKEARGELKLFMDADHSVKIENLADFIKEINNGSDIAIGSIEIPGSSKRDENEWYRLILGKMSKWLIRIVAVPGIHDTQRGFKIFNKKAAQMLFPRQTIYRWGFDIELLAMARKLGLKIKELPVNWNNRKSSSLNFWSYFSTLWELVRIRVHLFDL